MPAAPAVRSAASAVSAGRIAQAVAENVFRRRQTVAPDRGPCPPGGAPRTASRPIEQRRAAPAGYAQPRRGRRWRPTACRARIPGPPRRSPRPRPSARSRRQGRCPGEFAFLGLRRPLPQGAGSSASIQVAHWATSGSERRLLSTWSAAAVRQQITALDLHMSEATGCQKPLAASVACRVPARVRQSTVSLTMVSARIEMAHAHCSSVHSAEIFALTG